MPFLCNAHWAAQPGSGDVVFGLLQQLAEATRREAGNRTYEVFRDDLEAFRIVEVYDDEAAFAAHLASPHFLRLAQEAAIPLLASRSRAVQTIPDDQPGAPS